MGDSASQGFNTMSKQDDATIHAMHGEAARLVELADDIVTARQGNRTAAPILHEMVSRAGMAGVLAMPGEKRSVSAAELFDAFTSSRASQLRQQLEQCFEVVGLPNTTLKQELREADLMVRRGDGDTGHVAVIANPALKKVETLLSEGLIPESMSPGNYAEVVEAGVRPHTSSDHFARQLTDSFGRLLNNILLLRLATPPDVVQVQQKPAKGGDEPGTETEVPESCAGDISEFGRSWRTSHDAKRNPRPQKQHGLPLCRGQSDLQRHGPDKSTVDLLLFNFDIDGSYSKVQHEAALDKLISVIHERIASNPPPDLSALTYEISLQGYADRTGSARYNELLANDREAAVESYLRTNIEGSTKGSEASIGPRIRYTKMEGGFDPKAPPGRNSAHARSVLVWAIPVGGKKPKPRPSPPVPPTPPAQNRLDPSYWFLPGEDLGRRSPAFTEGNEVLAMVDGSKYMADLLTRLNSCDRGLYLAGWRFTGQQFLNPTDPSPTTVIDGVRNAIPRGAHVRAMIYEVLGAGFPAPFRVWHSEDNRLFCEALKAAGQEPILDGRLSPRPMSAHHQKFVLAESSKPERTFAYVGGIDLCFDRWDLPSHASTCPKPVPSEPRQCDIIEFYIKNAAALFGGIIPPWVQVLAAIKGVVSTFWPSQPGWHDVQARVRGPAMQQIWEVFRDRWNDPRPANNRPALKNCQRVTPISGSAPSLPPFSPGTSWVQVTQTLPCKGVFGPYPFAPRGEQTIEKAYRRAIDLAENYIYIEDQYLWPSALVDPLVNALKRGVHVVTLVARDYDLPGLSAVHVQMRAQVVNQLRAANPSHFKIFHLQQPAGGQIYVHAKTMIIDDMVAFVGSANLNHRSMTNDTELQLGILDSVAVSVPINGNPSQASKFAHEYRCELWHEHLGATRAQVEDPIVAINTLWATSPGPNRRVFPHQVPGPTVDFALLAELIVNLIIELGITPMPELPLLDPILPKKALQKVVETALRASGSLLKKVIDWLADILNPRLVC
jgi:phosphatidylserine/phosphatidylglycerophosphate/cardiolipin synthase-like enzyme/outer membrane protein OmpA-like peptidoglycan-associated protein